MSLLGSPSPSELTYRYHHQSMLSPLNGCQWYEIRAEAERVKKKEDEPISMPRPSLSTSPPSVSELSLLTTALWLSILRMVERLCDESIVVATWSTSGSCISSQQLRKCEIVTGSNRIESN